MSDMHIIIYLAVGEAIGLGIIYWLWIAGVLF